MAPKSQSAADRLDRLLLKIRGHPQTWGDLPRAFWGVECAEEHAAPRGAPSWAGGFPTGHDDQP